MSVDLKGLNRDLARDEGLFAELVAIGGGVGEIERWLRDRGYRLAADELGRVVSALCNELGDTELEAVSGGGGDSLTLQTVLNKRSRYLTTLANIMGATDGTADTMIDNLK